MDKKVLSVSGYAPFTAVFILLVSMDCQTILNKSSTALDILFPDVG